MFVISVSITTFLVGCVGWFVVQMNFSQTKKFLVSPPPNVAQSVPRQYMLTCEIKSEQTENAGGGGEPMLVLTWCNPSMWCGGGVTRQWCGVVLG